MRVRAVTPLAVVALAATLMGPAPKEAAPAAAVCTAGPWPAPGVPSSEPGAAAAEPGRSTLGADPRADEVGPPYFAIALAPTKKIPGTARASGTARVTSEQSPYGVAVRGDGSYVVDLHVSLSGLRPPTKGRLVVWAATPRLDRIERLGALDDDLSLDGRVTWNQFLLVVTLEDTDDASAKTWSGPIVFRGVSRSSLMHTMAGHGPFQQEWCAKYGYD